MLILDWTVQNKSPVCAVLWSVPETLKVNLVVWCHPPPAFLRVSLQWLWSLSDPELSPCGHTSRKLTLGDICMVWCWFGAGLESWASSAHCWWVQGQLQALGCSWMELVLPATTAGPRRDTQIQWLVAPLPKYLVARFGDSLFLLFCNGRRRWSPYIDFCGEKRLEKNPLDKGSEKH